MRALFTVHAGEFLVGEYLERHFKHLNVWIPSKDTGVDLLVTNKKNVDPISIQVKLSRDYSTAENKDDISNIQLAAGWLILDHKKIQNSLADYWVFILVSHLRGVQPQYIIITPDELLEKLVETHGARAKYHFYPWVLTNGRALDGRGLSQHDKRLLLQNGSISESRDLSPYFANWEMFKESSADKP